MRNTESKIDNIILTTDDGTLGVKGVITEALSKFNFIPQRSKIFACGPPLMMEAIRKIAFKESIECDLALERIMACGFGICQGCTVEKNKKNNEKSYRAKFSLACMDGPIFSAKEIIKC